MRTSVASRLVIVALSSCAKASCQTAAATNQLTHFSNAVAARAAAEDPTAGTAIASINKQCREDLACRK
jgi:ABC-type xylose transport system substrate-binding protein